MKIETQELAKWLFDYHEDGYLIWKNQSYKPVIGKRVYSYMRGKYLTMEYKNVKNTVHRVIFLWHHGYLPDEIDHDDRNKLNNRIGNLRDGDRDKNTYNNPPRGNTSVYKGVSLVWTSKKLKVKRWQLSFKCKLQGIWVVRGFKTQEEAALEYNKLAVRYHGEYAYLNIIQPSGE